MISILSIILPESIGSVSVAKRDVMLLVSRFLDAFPDNNGWTPIHSAANGGHTKIVQLLMSTTDTPNAPDNNGLTPMMIAQQNDFQEIIKLLIRPVFSTKTEQKIR